MLAKVYAINEFPNDDLFWRIEWLAGISYNPAVPSEPLIEATLALLPPGERDPFSLASRQVWRKFRTEIGVGMLSARTEF